MLKNRIFAILLALMLVMPIAADAEIFSEPLVNPAQEEVVTSQEIENSISEEGVTEESVVVEDLFKQPVSKKKMAKKFLLAMLGVTISSIVLFVLLSLYNKFRQVLINGASSVQKRVGENGEDSLQTPESLTQAVKIFLDKTKWN